MLNKHNFLIFQFFKRKNDIKIYIIYFDMNYCLVCEKPNCENPDHDIGSPFFGWTGLEEFGFDSRNCPLFPLPPNTTENDIGTVTLPISPEGEDTLPI